jgi:hypothetical protein
MSISTSIVEYKTAKYLGNVKEIYFEKKRKNAYGNISMTEI